jgi:hypothetical protein
MRVTMKHEGVSRGGRARYVGDAEGIKVVVYARRNGTVPCSIELVFPLLEHCRQNGSDVTRNHRQQEALIVIAPSLASQLVEDLQKPNRFRQENRNFLEERRRCIERRARLVAAVEYAD